MIYHRQGCVALQGEGIPVLHGRRACQAAVRHRPRGGIVSVRFRHGDGRIQGQALNDDLLMMGQREGGLGHCQRAGGALARHGGIGRPIVRGLILCPLVAVGICNPRYIDCEGKEVIGTCVSHCARDSLDDRQIPSAGPIHIAVCPTGNTI